MPTYDYLCTECSHGFEHFQSMTSDPLTVCPECEGKLRRLIGSGGALIFKGSGFYETDYKKGKKPASPTSDDGVPTGGGGGGNDGGGSDGSSGGGDGGGGGSTDSNSTSAA